MCCRQALNYLNQAFEHLYVDAVKPSPPRPRATPTGMPLYSSFLANSCDMPLVYEQYGLYIASFAGFCVLGKSEFRAYWFREHVRQKELGNMAEARFAGLCARAAPYELDVVPQIIPRLRMKGVMNAFVCPLIWIAYIFGKPAHMRRPKGENS